ncbi:response regulator PleD [mine drainage metagenome]|uniref:Response regulator PleD n=1 Tax=mine drainage metagenome TaxID=410659 RepID=A0A1J5R0V7_9ZZZZ
MGLDVRTIMVMFSMLTLMFSGLLEMAGLRAENIRGVRQWSVANLCLGLGFGLSYFYSTPRPGYEWAIVIGTILIAAGLSLQFTGIRAFKGEPSEWGFASLIVGIAVLQSAWFTVVHPDLNARAIANSILFALVYAACARLLLIHIEPPLRTAYWFTGLCFAFLAMVMLARGIMIWALPSGTYRIYALIPHNPLPFFLSSMVQLCVTFGFVLMLDYRLVMDLQKIASRDMLTGALNRRRLEEEAERLWARRSRTGDTLAVMMIDIDHFKSVNDRYGHQAGDEVLRHLAAIAQASIRVDDYFARYGGEEFCILLPSTTEKEAFSLAERLREAYAARTMEFAGKPLNSTISIGVADSAQAGLEFSSLLATADQALYRAKHEGRNRVVSYSTMNPLAGSGGLAHTASVRSMPKQKAS